MYRGSFFHPRQVWSKVRELEEAGLVGGQWRSEGLEGGGLPGRGWVAVKDFFV